MRNHKDRKLPPPPPQEPAPMTILENVFMYEDGKIYRKVFTVTVGDQEIEATFTDANATITEWIHSALSPYTTKRKRRASSTSAPIIAGLCAFLGYAPLCYLRKKTTIKDDHPIALISICIDSRCLLFPVIGYNSRCHRPIPREALRFLTGGKVRFVGIGAEKLAGKMERDLDIYFHGAIDLGSLVEKAIGNGADRSLEEMAEEVMGGPKVRKKPSTLEPNKWYGDPEELDEVMHATVDAYLSIEIGKRCVEIINGRRR